MNLKNKLEKIRFKNLNLNAKYVVAIVLAISLFLISTIIISFLLSAIEEDVYSLQEQGDRAIEITTLVSSLRNRDSWFIDYLFYQQGWLIDDYKTEVANFEAQQQELVSKLDSEKFANRFEEVDQKQKEINQIFTNQFITAVDEGNSRIYEREHRKVDQLIDESVIILNGIRDDLNSKRKVAIRDANTSIQFTQLILIISVIIAAISGFALVYLISKKVKENLDKVIYVTNEIATGNLNVEKIEYDGADEIGELTTAINMMIIKLKDLIQNIKKDSEVLLSQSQNLSASAQEGNATIEVTNDLIANMLTSITEMSTNIDDVTALAQESSSKTEIGSKNMKNTLNSISQINLSTDKTVAIINQLNDDSQEINSIIKMINGIAEQTNLLALNAAIEAARAGEKGKGFAVVAEEIRELATETNKATDRIADLIERIQNKSNNGLEAINKVDKRTKEGEKTAKETEEVFEEIKEASNQTAIQVEKTAEVVQNLSEKNEQIKTSTDDMEGMSDEIANSSQKLADVAQSLKSLVDKFIVG